MNRMSSNSEAYCEKHQIYKDFSDAEDYPFKLGEYLISLVKGKKVLDVCCGNGKYAGLIGRYAKSYTGIDLSKEQVINSNKIFEFEDNINFYNFDATDLPFQDNSFDLVISTWGICSISIDEYKKKALDEMVRVVRHGGSCYVVEADPFDEFNKLRNDFYHKKSLEVVRLILDNGFMFKQKIFSYFYFKSLIKAKSLFEYFWGEETANRIKSRRIFQEIIIFEKIKK